MLNKEEPLPTLDVIRGEFANFLANNKRAKIITTTSSNAIATISNPWDDESVALFVPADYAKLADTLNAVFLPEQFSALWHIAEKQLEFIWTGLPVSSRWSDLPGRRFVFRFKGRSHQCRFDPRRTAF
jgi:hypothetical protein